MLVHPQFDPVAFAIGPVAVRWYGLMYLVGFALFVVETDQMVSGYRHGDHLLRRHRRDGVLRPRVWVILDAL